MANRVHVYLQMLMLHIPSGVKSRTENTNGRTDRDGIAERASPFIYSDREVD